MQGIDASNITRFSDFPLSTQTLEGLSAAGFVKPTDIQHEALARGLEVSS
jgi:superfamily II DNA/RNA helicase